MVVIDTGPIVPSLSNRKVIGLLWKISLTAPLCLPDARQSDNHNRRAQRLSRVTSVGLHVVAFDGLYRLADDGPSGTVPKPRNGLSCLVVSRLLLLDIIKFLMMYGQLFLDSSTTQVVARSFEKRTPLSSPNRRKRLRSPVTITRPLHCW